MLCYIFTTVQLTPRVRVQGKAPAPENKRAAETNAFRVKYNILDMSLWSKDRVESCGPLLPKMTSPLPTVEKEAILNRSSSSKVKLGHYVVSSTGILHCFKIKAFSAKKKASLDADLVHTRLVKKDKLEGFERKLPVYRYVHLLYISNTSLY